MPRRPPLGYNVRRAGQRQRRLSWDDSPDQSTDAPATVPQSRPVGEVARHIRQLLHDEDLLNDVWIEGEVRGFNRSGAGHYYFDLTDAETDTTLACAFFRRENRGMAVKQGDQVLVHGSADLYLARGTLQIIVDDLRPVGDGVHQAEYERLFRLLDSEGLFSTERKRPLPTYPRRIGVVTSPSGAVWHDIQQVVARRWPLTSLILSPCLTQGAGSAESIAAGIERLNLLTEDVPDVIIVARGGGSPEDLWAYNEEPVARAIFASEIPVVSGIGHETDYSIADHVADRRGPTPSAAAEIAVPDRAEEAARVAGMRQAAYQAAGSKIMEFQLRADSREDRLENSAPHPPTMRVEINRRRADLDRAMERQMQALRAAQTTRDSRMRTLDPLSTLKRGYAIVTDRSGAVIVSAARLHNGQDFRVQLADGTILARATSDPSTSEEVNRGRES